MTRDQARVALASEIRREASRVLPRTVAQEIDQAIQMHSVRKLRELVQRAGTVAPLIERLLADRVEVDHDL